jgi:hypothetical protein
MNNDKIWCSKCNRWITYYLHTYVVKLENWDLFCGYCDHWVGGMHDYYGWEIEKNV